MTPLLLWSAKFEIDNQPSLDQQHEHLFKQVNNLFFSLKNDHSSDEIIALVSELQAETLAHFQHEEQFFYLLPEQEATLHRIHHKHLLEAMQGLYQFVSTNKPIPAQSAMEQLQEIAEWYQSHVLHSDSKLLVSS